MEEQTVGIGQIYRIKANKQNNITPKDGLLFRLKYFVVLGFDALGNVYGGVVFDSEINRDYISPDFVDFFLPISSSKYSFLSHDSYIDCRKMKPVLLSTLLEGDYCGQIEASDLDNILKLIKMSPRETYVRLRTFGII
ncbi:MAG: hypothetical protein K6D37_00225 [Prevotella sp.]|jgi:hypothetical protein|nr:hypothetical protein [Prevotella sp.]